MNDAALRPFDADNHYYEPVDAFTRYLDPAFSDRGIQQVSRGTHTDLLAGGRLFEFIPNPTFDPVIVPGAIDLWFRGETPDGTDPRSLLKKVEPLHAAYRDPSERLAVMDKQGLGEALLFPTLGMGVEEALTHDIDATTASITAFNRWLDDDWSYNYQDRLFAAPMLTLADPVAAVREVYDVISRGAKIVVLRAAPVPDGHGGSRSPGDEIYDEVWASLAKAGIPAAFHLGDSGYNKYAAAWGGLSQLRSFRDRDDPRFALASVVIGDRAIHDTIASLVVGGVFKRHSNLKIASIENGSDWVHALIKHLRKQANQTPWFFLEDPLDTIRRHVWIAPYYEEDIRRLADTIGSDKVLFGSDWPHGEGLANPTDFTEELREFSDEEIAMIMRSNVVDLLETSI
jgi:predicted TIM-barrel fold metal-dependent hydrolase